MSPQEARSAERATGKQQEARATLRHVWGDPVRFAHKTERQCCRCGLVKVSRHEGERHWVEWWRLDPDASDAGDIARIDSERTPPCQAIAVGAAANSSEAVPA